MTTVAATAAAKTITGIVVTVEMIAAGIAEDIAKFEEAGGDRHQAAPAHVQPRAARWAQDETCPESISPERHHQLEWPDPRDGVTLPGVPTTDPCEHWFRRPRRASGR